MARTKVVLPRMSRLRVIRNERSVGFIEGPAWMFEPTPANIPGLDGGQLGLCIATEILGAPVAAIVFPLVGDTIDITEPLRWSANTERVTVPKDESPTSEARSEFRLKEMHAALSLIGDLRHSLNFDSFEVDFRTGPSAFKKDFRDYGFRMEIDEKDGSNSYIRCAFRRHPKSGEGHFRGRSRYSADGSEGLADFRLDFLWLPSGDGRGTFKGVMRTIRKGAARQGDFDFICELMGPGRVYGGGRLRGKDISDFPMLWLIERTLASATSDTKVPFSAWIAAVRYDPESSQRMIERTRVAQRLASPVPLTAAELHEVANFLAARVPSLPKYAAAEALSPLVPLLAPESHRSISREFIIHLDESVCEERALGFMSSLAEALGEVGGRLCFAPSMREGRDG